MAQAPMIDGKHLSALMEETLRVQKDITETLIKHRSHILSLEFAVLAIAEQLVASGNFDSQKAAVRLVDLAQKIEPPQFRELAQPQSDRLAKKLLALSGPETPRPPHGSKPRIVK